MAEDIVALFVPISLGLGLFFMLWAIRYLENKENMALIERGIDPKLRRRQADPSRTLRNSLMFIGAGLGLLLAIILTNSLRMEDDDSVGIFFSLIAIFGGLGMLGAYLYERRNPPTFPQL